MKLLFGHADGENGVLKSLEKLNGMELPLSLFARIHKLLLAIKGEMSIYMPRRESILKNLCTMNTERNLWVFPKPDEEKYSEFRTKWNELFNAEIEFDYSPIDYMAIIDSMSEKMKNKISITGEDFDILDVLAIGVIATQTQPRKRE